MNTRPSLRTDAPIDRRIKRQLVVDLLNLACLEAPSPAWAATAADDGSRAEARVWVDGSDDLVGARNADRARGLADDARAELYAVAKLEMEAGRLGAFRRLFPAPGGVQLHAALACNLTVLDRILCDWLAGGDR